MYTIAQEYAIKLKHLYRMNKMEEGTPIKHGIQLWLRKKREQPPVKKHQSDYKFTP